MFILIGMWLCILYCLIERFLKSPSLFTIVFYSFIIFVFFTLIGANVNRIGLGMALGLIFAIFGIFCVIEGKRRANNNNVNNTKEEIKRQNQYDDNWGFNDFNK